MDQTEQFHFVSANPLLTMKRPRVYDAKSSTAGTCVGPMPLPDWKDCEQTWIMTFKDKKAMYGDARILPGGRPDSDGDLVGTGAQRQPQYRKDEDLEPVTYNALHPHLWEELMNQVGPRGMLRCVVDLTATEPTLASLAVEASIPYLGVCFNEEHLANMKHRLVQIVFRRFLQPKSRLHKPPLVLLLTGGPQAPPTQAASVVQGDQKKQDRARGSPRRPWASAGWRGWVVR